MGRLESFTAVGSVAIIEKPRERLHELVHVADELMLDLMVDGGNIRATVEYADMIKELTSIGDFNSLQWAVERTSLLFDAGTIGMDRLYPKVLGSACQAALIEGDYLYVKSNLPILEELEYPGLDFLTRHMQRVKDQVEPLI